MVATTLDPERVEALATEIFRHCFFRLMICQQACKPAEIEHLKQWEALCSTKPSTYYPITRRVLAYQQAKQKARNPNDIRALLVYEISHGREYNAGEKGEDYKPSETSSQGPRCKKDGGPIDYPKRQRILERIEKGYRLWRLRSLCESYDFIGIHLTEDEVFKFAGHEVNFSRLKREVIKPIEDQLET